MVIYWLMFILPAIAALAAGKGYKRNREGLARMTPAFLFTGLSLVILIGLRHQVGGDWFNYLRHLDASRDETLGSLLLQSDPGYRFLNWVAVQLDLGIYSVNVVGALIFTAGLLSFCRTLPRPWLALAVSIPYLVIVVAMGYTRQGIALGLAMLGLMALERGSVQRFSGWILAGTVFHRSALLLLPIAALASTKRRILAALWIGVLGLVGYLALLEPDVENLYRNYIEREYQSQGALIRLGMNAIAAVLFLLFRKRFALSEESTALWRWISMIALALFAAYFVVPGSSTALDRLGLYLLPLQLLVFSSLPSIAKSARTRTFIVFSTLGYFAAIQFVWLNYADNAYAWRPYSNWLIEGSL